MFVLKITAVVAISKWGKHLNLFSNINCMKSLILSQKAKLLKLLPVKIGRNWVILGLNSERFETVWVCLLMNILKDLMNRE